MKTKYLFSIIALIAFITACSTPKIAMKNDVANRIVGLWEVKAEHRSDVPGYKEMPHGMYKMVMDNGRFFNFMSKNTGSIITVDGSYFLTGDSIYTEKIEHSFNKSQTGMDNPLFIKLSKDKFMYLRWFQAIDEFNKQQNRWIEEIWQRVDIERMESSAFDLRQELRTIVEDKSVIDQILEP